MKPARILIFSGILFSTIFFSCEQQQNASKTKPEPQDFTPTETSGSAEMSGGNSDSINVIGGAEEVKAEPELKADRPPTIAELQKITPSQEAKRALSNDAMKAYQLKPDAFYAYMQSRIPYYQNKGVLRAENDMVRLEINEKEMRIESAKGLKTFLLH